MFLFKRRYAYAAVVAALALFASSPAIPLAMIQTEDGQRWVGLTPEEFEKVREIFAAQRARIEELEDKVREFKAGNGCS